MVGCGIVVAVRARRNGIGESDFMMKLWKMRWIHRESFGARGALHDGVPKMRPGDFFKSENEACRYLSFSHIIYSKLERFGCSKIYELRR